MSVALAQGLPVALQPLSARAQVLPGSDAPVLARWLEPEMLRGALGRYAGQWPSADARAIASQWHQEISALILPPLLLARLVCGRSASLDLQQLRMVVDEHGTPLQLHVPQDGASQGHEVNGAGQLEEIVEQLLQPFVNRFAAQTGLAPRLLWGNVALCVDWVLDTAQACHPTRIVQEARAHFRATGLTDVCRPLRNALRREAGGVIRRVCCLRERLPLACCAVCPQAPGRKK